MQIFIWLALVIVTSFPALAELKPGQKSNFTLQDKNSSVHPGSNDKLKHYWDVHHWGGEQGIIKAIDPDDSSRLENIGRGSSARICSGGVIVGVGGDWKQPGATNKGHVVKGWPCGKDESEYRHYSLMVFELYEDQTKQPKRFSVR